MYNAGTTKYFELYQVSGSIPASVDFEVRAHLGAMTEILTNFHSF